MANIKNIVKVMNFHSLVRVDKAKREAKKYFGVEDELCKILYQITNNTNLKLDKNILLQNENGITLDIYMGNDLGFCGDFNYKLHKTIKENINNYKIIIGKKISNIDDNNVLLKIEKRDFLNDYYKIDNLIKDYIYNKKINEINVYYYHYYNVNDIKFEKRRLFPLDIGTYNDVNLNIDFVIETDINELISNIISRTICYQIKIFESNSFASENVMREKITNELLDKLDKKEIEEQQEELKNKKAISFKRQINNYKNTMR